jgi:threonine synthase
MANRQAKMNSTTTEAPSTQLRCINCGAVPERAGQDFRCSNCGDLFEIVLNLRSPAGRASLNNDVLKQLWRDRKTSLAPADTSGVWRFRELLPTLKGEPITLREGNTPVYELPRSARTAGMQTLRAKHQGMCSTR